MITGLAADRAASLSEEVFGPVAARDRSRRTSRRRSSRANDTRFGLTAALFTTDLRSAASLRRGGCGPGVVKVNQESAGLEFQVPFGGMKESSSGSREQGKVAREFFTEWKTVYLDR